MNTLPNRHPHDNAHIEDLWHVRAHFVLLRDTVTKAPLWKEYQKRPPGPETIIKHLVKDEKHGLGIIPFSLGCSALDVDRGDGNDILRIRTAKAVLNSVNHSNAHLYFDDDTPRGNSNFTLFGCSGQVRSAKGFLAIADGEQLRKLHGAIVLDSRSDAFPLDLFDSAGMDLPEQTKTTKATKATKATRTRTPTIAPSGGWKLEKVMPGNRNPALFDTTRRIAYPLNVGGDPDSFHARIRQLAMFNNARFPYPLPDDEAATIAWSISSWVACRPTAQWQYDHSSLAQRRRVLKRWHGSGGAWMLAQIDARDALIADLYEAGWKQWQIADDERVKLTQGRVAQILGGLREKH